MEVKARICNNCKTMEYCIHDIDYGNLCIPCFDSLVIGTGLGAWFRKNILKPLKKLFG